MKTNISCRYQFIDNKSTVVFWRILNQKKKKKQEWTGSNRADTVSRQMSEDVGPERPGLPAQAGLGVRVPGPPVPE